MQVTLTIPDDLVEKLTSKLGNLSRAALESLALEAYRAGALSQAQVRRLLGFRARVEVDGFLKRHGLYLDLTSDDVEQDAANSERARS